MEIKVDRVHMYEIKDVQALKHGNLPVEYMNGMPRVHMSRREEELTLIFNENGKIQVVFIRNGDMISEYDFVRVCEQIELAGDRLHKINHKNDKKKTDGKEVTEWTGPFTFKA